MIAHLTICCTSSDYDTSITCVINVETLLQRAITYSLLTVILVSHTMTWQALLCQEREVTQLKYLLLSSILLHFMVKATVNLLQCVLKTSNIFILSHGY